MIEINKLTIDEYYKLLDALNWKRPSERLLKIGLENGINVKYILNGETIGMARFVTDGGYAGLIMDVIVLPEYQGNGYGSQMIQALIDYIKSNIEENEEIMIQLLSAPGKQSFYSKFGFKVKKEVVEDGMYMWLKNDLGLS